jgi:P-type conjugative transfer protein TrbG
MIWIAFFMIAAQAGVVPANPIPAPGVSAQQKQELSKYDFQGAGRALAAQTAQNAAKPASAMPIPPLRVPPLVTSSPTAPSTNAGAAQHNSELPPDWKGPHAELNAAATDAVSVAHQLDSSIVTPTPGADGSVMYIFGQGMPMMVCAPLRVCAIELESGEHLQSPPQIGDSRRWEITPAISGSGLDETPLLIVKPIEPGLETDLIVPTDRRTYVVRLISDSSRFVSRMAFQYPADNNAKWSTFQAQQDAAKHDAEALAEQALAKDKQAGVLPIAGSSLDSLYFDYKIDGNPALRPSNTFDDGQHTYLIFPGDGRFRETPTLLLLVNGKTEMVNFRVDGTRYIVDRLFDKALLVTGVGKKQSKVTITRSVPYSIGPAKGANRGN